MALISTLYEENFLAHSGMITGQVYRAPMFDYLAYLKHDTWELIPGLATKWQLSPDGMTMTIWLRQGVKFHNGDELTAEDVKFTIELLMRQDAKTPRAGVWRQQIGSVEIVDPYQFKVNFKGSSIWGFMADSAPGQPGNITVTSKKYVDSVGLAEAERKPMGSGPYRLAEHKRGEYVKYEALDDHWRVVPEFKYLIVRAVPEEATRVAMLKAGEADWIEIGPQSARELKAAGFKVQAVPGAYTTYAMLGGPWIPGHAYYNPNVPWADKRVRQAMNLAVNRQELAQHIYMGMAKPIGYMYETPGYEKLEPYPYDLAKAKQLLAEAGYPNGFELTMYSFAASPGAELPLVVEALAMYWDKIGIKVKIRPIDFAGKLPDFRKGAFTGEVWIYRSNRQTDFGTSLFNAYSSGPAGRLPRFMHPDIEKMLAELAATKDAKGRDQIMEKISRFVYDEYGVVSLVLVDGVVAMSKRVGSWPGIEGGYTNYLEYLTQNPPLGTFRLFQP